MYPEALLCNDKEPMFGVSMLRLIVRGKCDEKRFQEMVRKISVKKFLASEEKLVKRKEN